MSWAPIRINFIRNADDGGSRDDVLTVYKTEIAGRMFLVEYEDRTGYVRNRMVVPESDVLDFIESVFTLVPVDEDPFVNVQLTCPSFPAILLRPCDLAKDEIQTAVWRVVRNTLQNWPKTVKPSTTQLRTANPLSA
jgi:hypothetical protein